MTTAAQVLVSSLINQGADKVFGVPGESYLAVLDALYDCQNDIQYIGARHEGGAAFMAEAYGKLTGRPGLCMVTRGPGATNASNGVHTAMQNSTPMILFIGQIGRQHTQREAFQEINYKQFFGPIAKWVTQIETADRVPELIARAYSVALSGRPGPVVIALPEDMLREETSVEPCEMVRIAKPTVDAEDINNIAKRLTNAKRPLIVVGGSTWTKQGTVDLKAWSERHNIPVVSGFRSQSLIDTSSPCFIGDLSFGKPDYVKQALAGSDLILAMNVRFGEVMTDGWTLLDPADPPKNIIHSHISSGELGKIFQCDLHVQTCPNKLMAALMAADIKTDCADWAATARKSYLASRIAPETVGEVNMAKVCQHLSTIVSDNAVITTGAGNFAIWPGRYFDFTADRELVAPQNGTMGPSLPAAFAAKALDADRDVVCFTGDGDFQMSLQELGTAAQTGFKPLILIVNNNSYGTIRMHQEMRHKGRVSGTDIVNPEFADIAAAYGFSYAKVTRTADFEEHARAFLKTGGIIELVIDIRDIGPGKLL